MKKFLVLDFSSLSGRDFHVSLEKEFSKRDSFKGEKLQSAKLKKEISEFNLPVGSRCVLRYKETKQEALVCNVSRYSFEANSDFSEQNEYIYLANIIFLGSNVTKIIDYLEREWKI